MMMSDTDTSAIENARRLQDVSTDVHRHRWAPPADSTERARGIYLLHGTGEHAGRYQRLAGRLAEAGWQVGAHDHPGHGLSGGLRGRLPVAGAFATRAAIEIARFAQETGAQPYLFGHSLGGVVACELVLLHQLPVAGLLLSAPAIVPRLSWRDTVKLKTMSLVAPALALDIRSDPARLTRDLEQQAIALADPLLHGFKSAEFIGWLMRTAELVLQAADTLDVQTLVLIAGADRVIDLERTRQFVARAPARWLTVQEFEGSCHELLNEGPELRKRVEDSILEWLEERGA